MPGGNHNYYEYGQEPQKNPTVYGHPQETARRPLPNYKPVSLRWTFLVAIIALIMGCMALMEYAIQRLPKESGKDVISDFADLNRQLDERSSAMLALATTEAAIGYDPLEPTSLAKVRARVAQEEGTAVPSLPSAGDEGTVTQPPDTPPGERKPDPGTPETPTDPATPTDPGNWGGGGGVITATIPPSNHPTLKTTIEVVVTPIQIPTVIDGKSTTLTSTSTIGNVNGGPTYVPADVQTHLDSNGVPTATVTNIPDPVSTPTIITTTDSQGRPTTISTDVIIEPSVTVLTDENGIPTATQTFYPSEPTGESIVIVFSLSPSDYFIGYFLPTILAVLLTIPIRMIDLNAQRYYPFHELARQHGASARESLLLRSGGIFGIRTTFRALAGGKLLLSLSSLLVLCSAVLIPLSSEAVSLKLYNVNGQCTNMNLQGCIMSLSVFSIPARATVALLAFMIVLICGVMLTLRGWVSGVMGNPWSIAGIAALSTDARLRGLISKLPRGTKTVGYRRMAEGLEGWRFRLGYFVNRGGGVEYGVLAEDDGGISRPIPTREEDDISDFEDAQGRGSARHGRDSGRPLPFLMLSVAGRILFALFIAGILVLILYYNNTGGDTAFERFMSQQTFGVRFMFTSFGVIISFFWSSLFDGIAILNPYLLLSKSPQHHRSLLLSPPTNPFVGICSALRRRDLTLSAVALAAVLSEFLPILLNNVPFRVTQTYLAHQICTWAAVGVLSLMLVVVLGTFAVKWPVVPVDPSTVAGAMYYVADSKIVGNLGGVSMLAKRDRDAVVAGMGGRGQLMRMITCGSGMWMLDNPGQEVV
ncbi:uncharacterized protein DNG_00019 [Cephalotrichum gorgonifer]|uniref:Uncharacterized protein n=1 Tax=Cephalotrichum gorgonifer TaxID=2041049 RepID=A0AAE8SQD4_9PEZI|nr:uncharacterized protein DNG_00019 [Cephalotrichum gorgonifer]